MRRDINFPFQFPDNNYNNNNNNVIKLNEKRETVNARVSARARLIHFLSQEEGAYFKGALILFFKFRP